MTVLAEVFNAFQNHKAGLIKQTFSAGFPDLVQSLTGTGRGTGDYEVHRSDIPRSQVFCYSPVQGQPPRIHNLDFHRHRYFRAFDEDSVIRRQLEVGGLNTKIVAQKLSSYFWLHVSDSHIRDEDPQFRWKSKFICYQLSKNEQYNIALRKLLIGRTEK